MNNDFSQLEPVWQQALDEFYEHGSSSFAFEAISRERATGNLASNEIYIALLNEQDFRLARAVLSVCSHPASRRYLLDKVVEAAKLMEEMRDNDDNS